MSEWWCSKTNEFLSDSNILHFLWRLCVYIPSGVCMLKAKRKYAQKMWQTNNMEKGSYLIYRSVTSFIMKALVTLIGKCVVPWNSWHLKNYLGSGVSLVVSFEQFIQMSTIDKVLHEPGPLWLAFCSIHTEPCHMPGYSWPSPTHCISVNSCTDYRPS